MNEDLYQRLLSRAVHEAKVCSIQSLFIAEMIGGMDADGVYRAASEKAATTSGTVLDVLQAWVSAVENLQPIPELEQSA